MSAAPDITAVVPVWNRRELIAPLLANLRSQTTPPAEVLVVDNGSTDGAAEAAAAAGARVIRMGRNAGFAPAVNRGIAECRTAWVAVLNNDVILAPDYLESLRRAAAAAGAWFATGKILSAGQAGFLDATYDLLSRGGTAWRAGHGEPDGPAFATARPIQLAPWTAALFRAALFERVGMLEDRFESYLEDVEFGLRCVELECPGVYVPEARAWHQGSGTLGRWHPHTVRLMSRNQLWLAARHLPLGYWWPVLVAQGLWGAVALRHGAGWAWLRGKCEALGGLGRMRSTYRSSYAVAMQRILRTHERELHDSRSTYWRLYFFLTRGVK